MVPYHDHSLGPLLPRSIPAESHDEGVGAILYHKVRLRAPAELGKWEWEKQFIFAVGMIWPSLFHCKYLQLG
jgi:hypothetical protein